MSYLLNCFILGEDPFENLFQFTLDTSVTRTIGLLKNAIVESQRLNVATKDVKLWKVNFPHTGVDEEEKLDIIKKCKNVNINIEVELGGEQLSTISMTSMEFTYQPDLNHAHIIVQLPAGK
jgi:hypothetical protein